MAGHFVPDAKARDPDPPARACVGGLPTSDQRSSYTSHIAAGATASGQRRAQRESQRFPKPWPRSAARNFGVVDGPSVENTLGSIEPLVLRIPHDEALEPSLRITIHEQRVSQRSERGSASDDRSLRTSASRRVSMRSWSSASDPRALGDARQRRPDAPADDGAGARTCALVVEVLQGWPLLISRDPGPRSARANGR
jgi:hypothetical protein